MNQKQTNLYEVLKAMNEKQIKDTTGIVESIKKILTSQNEEITKLIYRCSALEVIQLKLFSILADTNPSVHKQVVEELKSSLKSIAEIGGGDTPYANHIRELANSQSGEPIQIRIGPKE